MIKLLKKCFSKYIKENLYLAVKKYRIWQYVFRIEKRSYIQVIHKILYITPFLWYMLITLHLSTFLHNLATIPLKPFLHYNSLYFISIPYFAAIEVKV